MRKNQLIHRVGNVTNREMLQMGGHGKMTVSK